MPPHKILLLAALATVLVAQACGSSQTQGTLRGQATVADLPRQKPGLWESKQTQKMAVKQTVGTFNGHPISLDPVEVSMKSCVGEKVGQTAIEGYETGKRLLKANVCTRMDYHVSGSTVIADSECRPGQTIVHATTTFQGNTAYRFKAEVYNGSKLVSTSYATARWLGACPPGVKPGDILGPDGKPMRFPGMKAH